MEWGWSRGVYCAVYIVRGGGGVEVFIVQFGDHCEGWGWSGGGVEVFIVQFGDHCEGWGWSGDGVEVFIVQFTL